MGMGNPSDPPTAEVIEKLAEAARDPDNHGYSKSNGILQLRREVVSKYFKRHGVRLDPETQTIVCLGSKEGFSHMCLALMGPGDTAIVPAPFFPVHMYGVALAAGNVITLDVEPADRFLSNVAYTCEHLMPRPKLVIVCYPHNPSTATVDPAFYVELVRLARQFGFMVISDFAYGDVGFDGYRPPSFLAAPGAIDVGVEFTTMSKGYNMAGWRVGFCCGNAEMIRGLGVIKGYYDYGMFQAIQSRGHHGVAARRRVGGSPVPDLSTTTRCPRGGAPSHRLGRGTSPGWHVRVGGYSGTLAVAAEHHGFRHDAAGAGQRRGQSGIRFRGQWRGICPDVAGGKRTAAPPGRPSNPALPAVEPE